MSRSLELRRPPIFAFANNDWNTPWRMARQHLYSRLATRGWPVIYSNGPQNLWKRRTARWQSAGLLGHIEQQAVGSADGAHVLVDAPGRLLALKPGFDAWNALVYRRHAARLSTLDRGPPPRIVYVWHHDFVPYTELLRGDIVVYHIHDAYDLQSWTDADARKTRQLVSRADLVITTAENMVPRLVRQQTDDIRVLPHGVEYDLFEAAEGTPCPRDLAEIPHPRIGYTGKINVKLDLQGIAEVAAARPDWHWVFIGAIGIGESGSFEGDREAECGWQALRNLPNVHFLGVKPQEEIPAYLQHMDLNTLIYRTDDKGYWSAGYPTKLHEYFATGKPIISSNLENVRPFNELLSIATNSNDLISEISKLLNENDPEKVEARKAAGRAGDWDVRAKTLEAWLLELVSAWKVENVVS